MVVSKLLWDDVNFLEELGKEIATQDNMGTETPVIFKLKETVVDSGYEFASDQPYIINTDAGSFRSADDFMGYIKEDYPDYYGLMIEQRDEVDLAKTKDIDIEEVLSLIDFLALDDIEFEIIGLRNINRYHGAFLTKKAAEQHLLENRHHYAENTRVYATHAWRNPEIEHLIKIIRQISE